MLWNEWFYRLWCGHWLLLHYTCPYWCSLTQCWRPLQNKGCLPQMINWYELSLEIVEGTPCDWNIYACCSSTSIIFLLSFSFWHSSTDMHFITINGEQVSRSNQLSLIVSLCWICFCEKYVWPEENMYLYNPPQENCTQNELACDICSTYHSIFSLH